MEMPRRHGRLSWSPALWNSPCPEDRLECRGHAERCHRRHADRSRKGCGRRTERQTLKKPAQLRANTCAPDSLRPPPEVLESASRTMKMLQALKRAWSTSSGTVLVIIFITINVLHTLNAK